MELIPAKTIISHNKNPEYWFGNDYTMNLYKGCCHGCIYCDSRSDCYQVADFDTVRAKENALLLLEKELASKRKKGIVGVGAMSDPYNPFERKYMLTGGSLERMDRYGFGVGLITKGTLVTRDVGLLKRMNTHSPVSVSFTVTTAEDSLSRIIEPHAPVSSERIAAMKLLADNGIYTGVTMMPILPFITDKEESILAIVRKTAEAGGRYILPMLGVTLRNGQREYFYEKLDVHFPGLKKEYIKLYGSKYECRSPYGKELWSRFRAECEKYNLIYTMPEIIEGIKNSVTQAQLSLFSI